MGSYKTRVPKYLGQTRGNWTFIRLVDEKNNIGNPPIWVRCNICGEKFIASFSSFIRRASTKCTCKTMLALRGRREREGLLFAHKRMDLELIWPSVIRAGRNAMEKYNAMASI